jgi:UTP--glucose-1-phosphate uridylyltransferase
MPKTSVKQNANLPDIIAVIPAAGLGARMLPWTRALPKELLPVNRKPMIQHAVEETLASGISEIVIVIRKGKEIIREYFATLLERIHNSSSATPAEWQKADLKFAYQKNPMGLGDAIYAARKFIEDSPFTMIIPDQFLKSDVPATRQLLEAANQQRGAVWSSLVSVSTQLMQYFPGVRTFDLTQRTKNIWHVKNIKNFSIHNSDEDLVGFGRTFFPAGVLDYFSSSFLNPHTGEVDLLLTFKALIGDFQNYAVRLNGRPMDFGTWSGYDFFSSLHEL